MAWERPRKGLFHATVYKCYNTEMDVLLAVIDDLWQFAHSALFGHRAVTTLDREREHQPSLPLLGAPLGTLALANHEVDEVASSRFRTGEQYFIGEVGAEIYSDPVVAFDTIVGTVTYGQSVLLKKLGGRWAEVVVGARSGWVLRDVLRERREDIHPQLHIDECYDAHHPETIKLRACIDDEFSGARAGVPLSAAEYVTYKLQQQKRTIIWQEDGPRIAGTWQRRLRGQLGIHIAIMPSTHSIMEYIIDDLGYLAYVEAVFPDKSIKVSQIGAIEEGQYTERMLTKEEYRELTPVFIEVM